MAKCDICKRKRNVNSKIYKTGCISDSTPYDEFFFYDACLECENEILTDFIVGYINKTNSKIEINRELVKSIKSLAKEYRNGK